MKKLFLSFTLAAVGLLCSVTAGATVYNDYEELLTALNSANGNSSTLDVTLGANFTTDKPLVIAGATVNLNMNGKLLENTKYPTIMLLKGTLNITGSGTILNSRDLVYHYTGVEGDYYGVSTKLPQAASAIYVSGSNADDAFNFSNLNIAAGVTVKSNQQRGIHIQRVHESEPSGWLYKDGKYFGDAANSVYYSNAKTVNDGLTTVNAAYGVNVLIDCVVEGYLYGLQLSGSVSAKPASAAAVSAAAYPVITVGEHAVISAHDGPIKMTRSSNTDAYKFGTGIYASGWAIWTIKGEVSGNNAVYAKGGQIVIDGAQLTATGDANNTVGKNGTLENGGKAAGSGTNGGGSALVIQSETGWAGNTSVTIQGDAVVQSEHGNAVQETVAPNSENKVTAIEFVSGTFIAEDADVPAVAITNESQDVVIVDGGTFSSGGVEDPTKTGVADVIDETKYVLTPVTEGYVVSKLPEGFTSTHTLAGATEKSYVQFINGVDDGFDETVSGDLKVAYIQIDCEGTITIPEGASLTVDEIVFSNNADDAVIIVEAGAKLLVTGNKGFVNSNYGQLIIEADESASGSFVFSPSVMSNKNPYATVEYVSETMRIMGDDYKFDIICSPFLKINAISVSSGSYFQMINQSGAWEYVNKQYVIDNAKAFDAIAIANVRTAADPKPVYTLKGQLQGNISGHIELKQGFNYYGNGFIANLDAKQVINAIVASGAQVRTLIYLWNTADMRYEVKTYRQLDELDELGAMKMFVLYADEDVEIDLDYNALIWNGNH